MNLTPSERETLAGPLVVGCVLGAVAGVAVLGLDSEYGSLTRWRMALDVLVAISASIAITVVPLGLLPIAVRRLRERKKSAAD